MGSAILEFSIKELAALFGLAQSVYILVYMGFRAGHISRSILPALFFLSLSSAFLLSAAKGHWEPLLPYYKDLEWFWILAVNFVETPLSYSVKNSFLFFVELSQGCLYLLAF